MPISIEVDNIQKVVRELQFLSPRTRRAANRAVRKTVTWATNRIIKEGAAAADVKQAGLRRGIRLPRGKRVYRRDITTKNLQAEASVYTGYNPLKTHYVGAINRWRRGQTPRVRSHTFPNAFVLQFKNGYRGIFRRGPGGQLVEETVDLDPVDKAVMRVARDVDDHLKGVLANELLIELKKQRKP